MKKNLDMAPERAPMIAGLKKEALLGQALGVASIASMVPTVKKNMAVASRSNTIMTPSQISRLAGTGV
jgi:hypothetical protein